MSNDRVNAEELNWAVSILDQAIDTIKMGFGDEDEEEVNVLCDSQYQIRNWIPKLHKACLKKEEKEKMKKHLEAAMNLFKRYGYNVERFGAENSFIAFNDTFCIPCSLVWHCPDVMATCSTSIENMEALKKTYTREDVQIGWDAYHDMDKWRNSGMALCNHDHSLGEVEYFLKRTSKACAAAY